MTVPAQSTLFNESTANGLTTSFPYEFKIASSDDITVMLDGVAQTTGYSVTGIGEDVGGNVVFAVAPASGVIVLRYLDPVLNREENYPQFGDFSASVVNLDFDRLWLAMQSLTAGIRRAIKMPVSTAADQTIPQAAAARSGKVVGFDSSGNVELLAKADIGSTVVSAFMSDFIQAGTEADARVVIGAAASADLGSAAYEDASAFQAADADIATVSASQAEMEAGTEAALRSMSPLRVAQAFAAKSLTLMTAVATTSGTSVDITGIPSWAKRITLTLNGVSTNGTSPLFVRIGSGSIQTTGYESVASMSSGAGFFLTSTAGFVLEPTTGPAAPNYRHGSVVIDLHSGNTYVSAGSVADFTYGVVSSSAGRCILSAAMDRVRITTVGGADTFDAGSINVTYE